MLHLCLRSLLTSHQPPRCHRTASGSAPRLLPNGTTRRERHWLKMETLLKCSSPEWTRSSHTRLVDVPPRRCNPMHHCNPQKLTPTPGLSRVIAHRSRMHSPRSPANHGKCTSPHPPRSQWHPLPAGWSRKSPFGSTHFHPPPFNNGTWTSGADAWRAEWNWRKKISQTRRERPNERKISSVRPHAKTMAADEGGCRMQKRNWKTLLSTTGHPEQTMDSQIQRDEEWPRYTPLLLMQLSGSPATI